MYVRALLIGYFEYIGTERGDLVATGRLVGPCADLLGGWLDDQVPNHSTILRTRRLIDLYTHHEVFG